MPDALFRLQVSGELAAAGFEEIKDRWYLKILEDVPNFPKKYKDWRVEERKLYRYRMDPLLDPMQNKEEKWRLEVSAEYRARVLNDAHCMPSSGHLGVKKTYDRVAKEYYWKGVYHDVHNFVRECDLCERYKVAQTGPQGLMGNRVIERPWAVVAADTMEFPPSKTQNRYWFSRICLRGGSRLSRCGRQMESQC